MDVEAEETAQWAKHLPPKYENLCSDLQNPHETRHGDEHLESQFSRSMMGGRDQTLPQELGASCCAVHSAE